MSLLTKKPVATLSDLEQALTDLRGRQQENELASEKATNELIGLMSAQRTNEATRAPLVEAHQKATQATQEARAALGRHIGKSTEHVYSEKLATAEQALSVATQDLERYDAQFDREATHARIVALREQLQELGRTQAGLQEQKQKLAQEREIAAATERKGALQRILSAYSDLLDVFEHDGIALATMRDDNPGAFNHLLEDLALGERDLWDLIIGTPEGASSPTEKGTWRPLIAEKQAAIKGWLAKQK